jgi:hypothetical protein
MAKWFFRISKFLLIMASMNLKPRWKILLPSTKRETHSTQPQEHRELHFFFFSVNIYTIRNQRYGVLCFPSPLQKHVNDVLSSILYQLQGLDILWKKNLCGLTYDFMFLNELNAIAQP